MKTGLTVAGIVVVALVAGAAIYMVDIDQTEEASLPEVNVSVEEGNMPEFDAEVGSVGLTEEEVTVETPDVDVDVSMEESTVTVPGIEVTPPEDENN
ncbi:hypothetical protein ABMC89_03090 [Sulfitobacter sp. HNIBRBA3233]|uniref:hypothetical protein n=1 Tax=Sulfitobacter marinivivus TaxID=3158558 RepID=UPI0032DF1EFB